MLEWNDLSVILAVCRAGSLSGAARTLGLNHSTVFRKINAIEERTGVRFFERLPSGYRMTEAGESAQAYAERIENEVHALGRELVGQDGRLAGHVRVTAPEGLTALTLPHALADFTRQHPDVSIELVGTASALSLSRREAEVAIRATRRPPDDSLGRKVCQFRFGIYGAPAYLESRRDVDFTELEWCWLSGMESWVVPRIWKKRADLEERRVIASSSIIGAREAAAAGVGVTLLPFYLGEPDNRLERLHTFEDLVLDLWVLTHPDLRHTARVRAMMDHLHGFLLDRRAIFEGR